MVISILKMIKPTCLYFFRFFTFWYLELRFVSINFLTKNPKSSQSIFKVDITTVGLTFNISNYFINKISREENLSMVYLRKLTFRNTCLFNRNDFLWGNFYWNKMKGLSYFYLKTMGNICWICKKIWPNLNNSLFH